MANSSRFPSLPAWWYDPKTGEGKVFEHANDIPKGWIDNPHAARKIAASGPAAADTDGSGYATVAEIKAALEAGTVTIEEVEAAENAREKPRTTVLGLIEKQRAAGVELVGGAKSDDSLLTREQAIAELKEAGVEIDDTASDEEIEAALAGLEE